MEWSRVEVGCARPSASSGERVRRGAPPRPPSCSSSAVDGRETHAGAFHALAENVLRNINSFRRVVFFPRAVLSFSGTVLSLKALCERARLQAFLAAFIQPSPPGLLMRPFRVVFPSPVPLLVRSAPDGSLGPKSFPPVPPPFRRDNESDERAP